MKIKFKILKKRFASFFMALIMLFGCFGYIMGASESAEAASVDLSMEIDEDGEVCLTSQDEDWQLFVRVVFFTFPIGQKKRKKKK